MTAAVDYEVRRYRGDREMTELLSLRHDVFCVEQGVPVYEELDGRDGEGVHLVAVSDGAMLATCRLLFVGPTVQFSRLAVRQSARRQGIATALLPLADKLHRALGTTIGGSRQPQLPERDAELIDLRAALSARDRSAPPVADEVLARLLAGDQTIEVLTGQDMTMAGQVTRPVELTSLYDDLTRGHAGTGTRPLRRRTAPD